MKYVLFASASAVAFLASPAAVMAQTAPDQSGETRTQTGAADEIVVTATRREMNLQDVPLSVTAFTQEELTTKGIVGYEGLALETPGAVLNKPTANFNTFSVRGIATNGYQANLQNSVAVYIDELPISANGNSTQLDSTLFDVERVEFLRGPQGTLFGSGSLAGAVRIITKSPDLNDFDAQALVDFGLTDGDSFRQRYNGMVNIPLVEDKLALRVVGFYRNEEGWVENIGTGEDNANTLENWGGRAVLLWEPTSKASVRLMALHEKSEPEDSQLINPNLDPDRETRNTRRPDVFGGDLDSYNATFEYDLGFANFTSSTTYSYYAQSFIIDLDATFGGAIPFALDAFAYDKAFVEEARLVSSGDSRLQWIVGGFYYYKRRDTDLFYRSDPAFLDAFGMTGLPDEYYQRAFNHTNSEEIAAFGEATYNFSDRFWLTGGLRYGSLDVQSFAEGGYNSNYLTNALFGIPGPLTVTQIQPATGEKGTEKGFSYKLSASFKPVDNVTTYATYSTGFRAPAVNARAGLPSSVDPNDIIIPDGASSDDLKNYEIGVKGNWFNGKLSANLAAYYIDWSNIQVQANRVSDQVQFATNIGGATSKGIEFEMTARPVDGLSIGLNGSFNDSEVTDLTPEEAAISGAVKGIQLAFPEFQGGAYLTYTRPLTATVDGFLSVNARHVQGYPNQFPNVPGQPGVQSPTYAPTEAYETVNMSAGADFGDHFKATLYVENAFDDHSLIYSHPEGFADARFSTLRPRTFGVRLNYKY
ncbi:MAG: TonB-dependent receptor [Euryhalocaulis sp.]|uniref:TonB-dependent receptor n=1 Tax=Euryhalocaulis sp. TaxID=2744307 RepID=UPI0017E860F6|nr:TonB-dependent receptor [Euryhalocaulis sp.]MBA4800505.1 TonB-dependent receptor [Euryhalocaulis sp.]